MSHCMTISGITPRCIGQGQSVLPVCKMRWPCPYHLRSTAICDRDGGASADMDVFGSGLYAVLIQIGFSLSFRKVRDDIYILHERIRAL